MKRFLTFLLFLLVACTAVAPCAEDTCCSEERAATEQGSRKHDAGDGACSPFSICSGCHAFTTPTGTHISMEAIFFDVEHKECYRQPVPTPAFATPWQPPRWIA